MNKTLKEAREALNLSQKNVSDYLGYDGPQFVSNWERGVSLPALKDVKKLCKLLKLDFETVSELIIKHKVDETIGKTKKGLGI